jgi:hypothetical protein
MNPIRALASTLLALGLAACATTGSDTAGTSNAPAGAAAASASGATAIGAYGAVGTSDDVRGRTSSASASQLTGRATMAGNDAGTDTRSDADTGDATATDDEPPRD